MLYKYFNCLFFLTFECVRTLGNMVWKNNFLKYSVVYHDHKLIILKWLRTTILNRSNSPIFWSCPTFIQLTFQIWQMAFHAKWKISPFTNAIPSGTTPLPQNLWRNLNWKRLIKFKLLTRHLWGQDHAKFSKSPKELRLLALGQRRTTSQISRIRPFPT